MRRAEARSAGIDRPDGVSLSFQVSVYKVEPVEAVLRRNLLAKNDVRAALRDEVVERGPEVPLVIEPAAFACRAERLAGARACPHRSVVVPSCSAQGVGPDADAGEEVALSVGSKVIRVHVHDTAFVDVAWCDVAEQDEGAEPLGGLGVDLVVVDAHFRRPSKCCCAQIPMSAASALPLCLTRGQTCVCVGIISDALARAWFLSAGTRSLAFHVSGLTFSI